MNNLLNENSQQPSGMYVFKYLSTFEKIYIPLIGIVLTPLFLLALSSMWQKEHPEKAKATWYIALGMAICWFLYVMYSTRAAWGL